jgi:hypothetical protein
LQAEVVLNPAENKTDFILRVAFHQCTIPAHHLTTGDITQSVYQLDAPIPLLFI